MARVKSAQSCRASIVLRPAASSSASRSSRRPSSRRARMPAARRPWPATCATCWRRCASTVSPAGSARGRLAGISSSRSSRSPAASTATRSWDAPSGSKPKRSLPRGHAFVPPPQATSTPSGAGVAAVSALWPSPRTPSSQAAASASAVVIPASPGRRTARSAPPSSIWRPKSSRVSRTPSPWSRTQSQFAPPRSGSVTAWALGYMYRGTSWRVTCSPLTHRSAVPQTQKRASRAPSPGAWSSVAA